MSYRIIHGVYRLLWQDARTGEDHGSRPDGDSVWFEPDDPLLLNDLGGVDAKLNGGGCAQLRLEAIDALELHHAGAHQRRPECERARSFLVEQLGFRSLFAPGNGVPSLVRVARPDAPRGFIATRGCDSPQTRRPVAFAFVGRRRGGDSAGARLDADDVSKSLNAALLASGWAYPMFYASSLPTPLHDALRAAALEARRRRRGVWKVDSSMRPTLARPRDLADLAIWPKLWRRLVSYYRDGGVSDLSAFQAWMRANARDRDDPLFRCRLGELGNMYDVVEVIGRSRIRLRDRPEDVLVISEQEGTIDSPSPISVRSGGIRDVVSA